MLAEKTVVLTYLPVQFGGGHTYGLPPLGIYYLGAALQKAGISVVVVDASIKGLSLTETAGLFNANEDAPCVA